MRKEGAFFVERKMSQSLRERLPKAESARSDEAVLRKEFYRTKGNIAVEALKKNGFTAYYADTREEAGELIYSLVPEDSTVSYGDSHTLFALNLEDRLRDEKKCDVISHRCILNSKAMENPFPTNLIIGNKEEMRELVMRYLVSDVFILGANGISMDGQIVNVDGRGNRVVGGIFGPERIIVVAGANKLAPDVQAARERIGFVAAPINCIKYNLENACVKGGKCVNCRGAQRLCNVTTVIHKCPRDADYHVIIVGEEMGF